MIVYFNGFRMHTKDNSRIAQTKQINNMFDLSTRQTNFTNAIDFPREGANIVAMEFLGVTGNNSTVPYRLNSVSMYSDSGECFIYNGRCVILSTTDVYKVQFLDGNIDLYKAIGNDKLGDLDLTETKHIRNTETVFTSWFANKAYKYIVADYNGKNLTDEGYLNIDYLVPSVKVSYLWNQLFTKYGFTYSGSFFDSEDFQKLWLTYPSGAEINESETVVIFESNDYYFNKDRNNPNNGKGCFLQYNTATVNTMPSIFNKLTYYAESAGTYRFKIKGKLTIFPYPWIFYNGKTFTYNVSLGRNLQGSITANTDASNFADFAVLAPNIETGGNAQGELNHEVVVQLEAGDTINLMVKQNVFSKFFFFDQNEDSNKITFTMEKINDDIIDFNKAFQDLGVKDLLNEINNRHALVPIKDKYSNNYHFYTLDEMLGRTDVVDWSDKNPSFKSENYLYNAYQQRNYFRLKYDNSDSEFNDGFIQINNETLDDKTDVWKSPLYSPESYRNELLTLQSNVYKLWNKDIKDDGTISYKSIDKRFYFISYQMRQYQGIIGSDLEPNDFLPFSSYPAETFRGLDYSSAINKFYRNSSVMLNKALVMQVEMLFSDVEIANIDLSKQYYFKQYASRFLINKINNYLSPTIPTTVEMIKLGDYVQDALPVAVIYSVSFRRLGGNQVVVTVLYNQSFFDINEQLTVEFKGLRTMDISNTGMIETVFAIGALQPVMRVQIYGQYAESEIFSQDVKF